MIDGADKSTTKARWSASQAIADAGRLMRLMAVLFLVVMVVAQGVAPAVKGVLFGSDRLINALDNGAAIGSHLVALTTSASCIGLMLLFGSDEKIGLPTRVLLILPTVVILILGVPASRFDLSPEACFLLGMTASALALVAATQGLRHVRSRAAALTLGVTALGGAARVTAVGVGAFFSRPPPAVRLVSTTFATVSLVLQAVALIVGFAWLVSRVRRMISLPALATVGVSMLLSWAALRGVHAGGQPWQILVARVLGEMMPVSGSMVSPWVEVFMATLGPLLALAILITRGQMSAVVASMAFAFTAGTSIDVPGRALALTLGALSTVLASRDDRGMWESITRGRSNSAGTPV